MKKIFLTVMATAMCSVAFAGGLFTNTNQNVHFLRNPARAASTDIDAVYSNPAGLSFLDHEGLTLSLNNQSAFQTRTATTTFAPFAMNGGSKTKQYKGEASALFIPSLQAAYKWKNFVFSGSFAVVGGGGSLLYENGLPMFEADVAMLPLMLTQGGIPTNQYSLESRLKGNSATYGVQLGVTYKINYLFSGFVGARASFVGNGYEGYIRNIQANIGGGSMQNVNQYFTNAATQARNVAGSLQPAIDGGYGDVPSGMVLTADQITQMASALGMTAGDVGAMSVSNVQGAFNTSAATAEGVAAQTRDMALDLTQSGWGIAPILGLNFNYEKLNIGVKYDFNTNIELKNSTKVNTTPMSQFNDDVKSNYDTPALLTIGASYKFFEDKLVASAGYHVFFNKGADLSGDIQKYLDNSQEFLAGLEYRINDRFLVSAGGQLTRLGLSDNYQSDMSFTSNSFSLGFGGEIKITERLSANLGYFLTLYEDYAKENPIINPSKVVYSRTNNVFGIGLDYKF